MEFLIIFQRKGSTVYYISKVKAECLDDRKHAISDLKLLNTSYDKESEVSDQDKKSTEKLLP